MTIQRMEKVPVITDCCPFSSSTPPHFDLYPCTWPAVPKPRGRCGASAAAPPGTLHLLWGWSLWRGGIGGWADRSECKVHSLLKFSFFLSSYSQGPFLALCGNFHNFKRLDILSMGASPVPGHRYLAHFVPSSQTLSLVGFVILFPSAPSFTANVSPRGQMASLSSSLPTPREESEP